LEKQPNQIVRAESETGQSGADAHLRAEYSARHEAIRESGAETRRLMRELHEEVIAQIAIIEERQRGHGASRKDS
jgi:hypothetical protein